MSAHDRPVDEAAGAPRVAGANAARPAVPSPRPAGTPGPDTPRRPAPLAANYQFGAPIPPLLYEISREGRRAVRMSEPDVPHTPLPAELLRDESDPLVLPEVSEQDVVRHYTRLSHANMAIDTAFYPLGSCTMKYNPKVNEEVAAHAGFARQHPLAREADAQGALAVMYRLQHMLAEIAGFSAVSLQPAAGAQGELTGILMIRAYHESRRDTQRTKILVPDSAHGTNPATVTMAGYQAVEIPSDDERQRRPRSAPRGVRRRRRRADDHEPEHRRLFEEHIGEVVAAVHGCGALVYGDGANFNAILGVVRPGDLGIDVMHFNLHKTFSTPHGGGGPGSGPVGANETLAPFLPGPVVRRRPEHTHAAPLCLRACRIVPSAGSRASTGTSGCCCAPTPTS